VTPEADSDAGLVQMVSVLALNRLELREMINQEMMRIQFWKQSEEPPQQTITATKILFGMRQRKFRKSRNRSVDEFDVGTFFNQYSIQAARRTISGTRS